MWLIVILYALFATSFPISKVLLTYASPFFLSSARTLVAGVLLLTFRCVYRNPRKVCSLILAHSWYFIQIIVVGIYVNYTARYWAMNHLPSAKAGLLFSVEPILSLFFSYLVFGETATKRQWTGFGIGFLSLIPILVTSSLQEKTLGEFVYVSWPELFMLVSVAANSYRWVLMRKLVRDHNYSVSFVNGISMTIGGLLALITSYFIEGYLPVQAPLSFAGWLLLAIFISNVVCTMLYSKLLRSYTATFLSLAGFMTPLFAAAYGSLFFHESISWHYYLSVLLLAISLYLFYKDESINKIEPDEELVSS